jgi:hypothetical protein
MSLSSAVMTENVLPTEDDNEMDDSAAMADSNLSDERHEEITYEHIFTGYDLLDVPEIVQMEV